MRRLPTRARDNLPIILHDGKIIDGRNRYNACKELDIPAVYEEWDKKGSLIETVISLNLRRRQLTSSQIAVIALKAVPFFEAEAKLRQKTSGGDKKSEQAIKTKSQKIDESVPETFQEPITATHARAG